MKNINRIFITVCIIISLVTAGCLSLVGSVKAQNQQKLLFAVTPYREGQNLDFFFSQSVHPIAYYERSNTNTPVKIPVFLSIISPEQKEEYIKAGYAPVIVDENAGNLEQYYALYSRESGQANLLTNPVYKKQGLELVYPLTDYATLIKLTPGMRYSHLDIPGLEKFRARKFFMDLVPPTDRTTKQPNSITPAASQEQIEKQTKNHPVAILIFVLAIIIIIFAEIRLKKTLNKVHSGV